MVLLWLCVIYLNRNDPVDRIYELIDDRRVRTDVIAVNFYAIIFVK